MTAPGDIAPGDIAPGDRVPPLTRTIDLPMMVAYAGATWDWHRLHYDPGYLAERGLPAPVVDGQLFGALLVAALQDWLGPRAEVRALSFRFAGLVFAGETVRCEGEVTEVTAGGLRCALRVVVVDTAGGESRVAAQPCAAELRWRG